VRLGIRAQLLLSLGALLVLALVPLFMAVASLTRASMQQSWERQARALGRAIAGHVSEARRSRSDTEVAALLDAQIGSAVGAIALYDTAGKLERRAGEALATDALPAQVDPKREQAIPVATTRGAALLVVVPGEAGAVGALLHTDPSAVNVAPLVRLVALYIGLLGLTLLVFSYFVLTRLVVVPIDKLSRAARRVADGARQLSVPRSGGRELVELGSSVAQMTERLMREEEQLREKIAEVEAATEELKDAQDTLIRTERLASVGRLAAGLAHEIGNPITAILSFQELMLGGELDDEQREFVERMKRETERVNKILRDLLDFARPAAAGDDIDEGAAIASVPEAVEHVLSLVKPQQSFAQVKVSTELDTPLPPVAMRSERIEQVLLNLLLNAADEVPKPGGDIRIRAHDAEGRVRVLIEDNGGGIDESVRERLFEPFVTTKEVGKGTGLGLSVCRGLMQSAGGTIEVEDGERGARFVLELPKLRRSTMPPPSG
jgi:signal transduction histidine kinase